MPDWRINSSKRSRLQRQSDEVIKSLDAGPSLQRLLASDDNVKRDARTFCQDPSLQGNLLGSFLGSRHEEILVRLLGAELMQKRFVPTPFLPVIK
jgi:hypothetical protein